MSTRAPVILLCDEDRLCSDALAYGLDELGYAIEIARSFGEAFAIACRYDLEALVTGSHLRDGTALALPAALGIRKPPLVVLATRIGERIASPVAQRVGFDVQLTKVLDPRTVAALVERRARREQPARRGARERAKSS